MAMMSQNGVPLPDGAEQIGQSHYYVLSNGHVVGTQRQIISEIDDVFAAIRGCLHQTESHDRERKLLHGTCPVDHGRLEDIDGIETYNVRNRVALQTLVATSNHIAAQIQECLAGGRHQEFLHVNIPPRERGQQIAALQRELRNNVHTIPDIQPLMRIRCALDANIAQLTTHVKSVKARELLRTTYDITLLQELKARMEELRGRLIHPGIHTRQELQRRVTSLLPLHRAPRALSEGPMLFGNVTEDFYKHLEKEMDAAMTHQSLDACARAVMHVLKSNDPLFLLPQLIPEGHSFE